MKAKKRSGGEKEVFDEPDEVLDDDDLEERGSNRKRRRSSSRNDAASRFIDMEAEVDIDEEDEDEDADDDGFIVDSGADLNSNDEDAEEEQQERGSNRKRRRSSSRNDPVKRLIEFEAEVNCDEEDEEDGADDDDFIVDSGADLNPNGEDGEVGRVHRRPPFPQEDEEENLEDFERRIEERYSQSHREIDHDEGDGDEIEQQALLPCVRDPKLWMVRCAIGHERELALCLMQKCIDKKSARDPLQIRSAIALDDLKIFIYVEADKEAHVREACKGLRDVISQKITLVPIKEMTGVVSVKGKAVDVLRDSWVRMKKIKMYEGNLGKVVDVDNVRQRITVKLVPRIDLQSLARKLAGMDSKKKAFRAPARLMNIDEARGLGIRVERRRDPMRGGYFEKIGDMLFKDGFLYKTVSRGSISCQSINPTLDELEKFRKPDGRINGDEDHVFSMNRKKGGFVKGDAVVVVKGDLKKLVGRVEKVEGESVHIRPEMKGLPETLVINSKELCKFFKLGNHVKVVSGSQEGATGMVVKVDQEHGLVTILSDKTKQHIYVFADDVAESSGSDANGDDGNGGSNFSRYDLYKNPRKFSRGGRGHDANGLGAGTRVRIRQGPYKGYSGRVVEVKGSSLRVELESQMKIVLVDRSCVSDSSNMAAVATPYLYGGNETPMRPCSTPLHPYIATPMRDPRATPIHDGMRTPMLH